MTKDSAIAVGKSVELRFDIPDKDDSTDGRNSRRQSTSPYISVVIHAIPVFDGQLITSEKDLYDALNDVPEMRVELINDFDVPWIEYKSKPYPKYRKKL